jgi:hypothetical protein
LGCQIDKHEGAVGGVGYLSGIVDFLKRIDLVEKTGML